MAYDYHTLLTALAAVLAVPEDDTELLSLYPTIIDDTEQICYRELGLLSCQITVNATLTPNTRYFALPTTSGRLLVVDQVNVLDADNSRHSLAPASRDWVDYCFPSDTAASATAIPSVFARIDDGALLFGGAPGDAWTAEIVGTVRPTPLSATNLSTVLTLYLSDLFLAGCVVSATGSLLKQWSAVADDPQMPVTWMTAFREKLASAKHEETRKNYVNYLSLNGGV
jgi:hypothetical protein